MATVSLNNVIKKYGDTQVVHGVDLDVADGEFVVLLGPSGCGKSTTLRMVAGLEDISGGTISIGTRVVNGLPAKDRGIAMVFQSYALYPHKTVRQNMAFGLKLAGLPRQDIDRKVKEVADILELGALLDRKPAALSGGQRQRVAMGRAMVRTPEVFLFDEPLSNLDAKLRAHMRLELQKLHQQLATTTLYVTHDQIEAMTLADRIVIMKDGYIEQIGTPRQVYYHPKSIFVATFIGSPAMNMIKMTACGSGSALRLERDQLHISLVPEQAAVLTDGQQVMVGIRPNDLTVRWPAEAGSASGQAIVDVVELLGADALLNLRLPNFELLAEIDGKEIPERGTAVSLGIDPAAIHLFDHTSGRAVL